MLKGLKNHIFGGYGKNKSSAHSQAHLQFAQANAQTKNCKRACLSATADFADTIKLNLLRQIKRND